MNNKRTERYLLPTLLIIAVMMFSAGCPGAGGNRKPIDLNKPKTAPDFSAVTIDGETISLSDYKGKKAVIIDIWATWCGPCQMEMPLLEKIYANHKDKLEIIAASVDNPNDLPKIQKFVKEKQITFKIVHDFRREISGKYPSPSQSIPFLTIIDKEGGIVKTIVGYKPDLDKELEKLLKF